MKPNGQRWRDRVASMPRLSGEQMQAVFDLMDYHLGSLSGDYPRVDEAHYMLQQDVQSLTHPKAKP